MEAAGISEAWVQTLYRLETRPAVLSRRSDVREIGLVNDGLGYADTAGRSTILGFLSIPAVPIVLNTAGVGVP